MIIELCKEELEQLAQAYFRDRFKTPTPKFKRFYVTDGANDIIDIDGDEDSEGTLFLETE